MATKKKGLGRGLDTLLGSQSSTANESPDQRVDNSTELAIELIRPGPYQPRSVFDQEAIDELAQSIQEHGMIQPIIVRSADEQNGSRYEIIAGERRWRAAQVAGLHQVPVIVREIEAQSALAIALIENIQREDLTSIEEARALQKLHQDYQLTHAQVGEAVGRSRTAVSNLIRLLELNENVQQAVLDKKIDMGHARTLLGCDKATQSEITKQIIAYGLTVRETETLVKKYHQTQGHHTKTRKSKKDPNIKALEQELSEQLSTNVNIQTNDLGAGKVTIKFSNLDILDGLLARIKQ